MGFVSRTFRHTKRYQEIISVLIRYGMGDIVRSLGLAETFPFLRKVIPKRNARPVSDLTRWEDIRMAVEELGPTFVKFGQMLSNRPDILPPQLIAELAKLQDDVPPFPGAEAVRLVEQELSAPMGELFESFNETPLASASIGQVHLARLPGGKDVAVKVQRPGIEDTIKTDLEILHTFARLAENNIEHLRYINPTGIAREFDRQIRQELDYNHERLNLEHFQKIFEKDSTVYVPAAYRERSTKRVFTMEYIEGVKVSRIADEDLPGYDRKVVAYRGATLILKQIFLHGFFHADPHPGNIVILDGDRVCFLDFGMMGSLIPAQRELLGTLLIAIERRNSTIVTNIILELTKSPDHDEKQDIEYEVHELIDRYVDLPLAEMDIGEILESLMQLMLRFKLRLPSDLVMMGRSIVMIEGVGRQIYPQFQISDIIKDIVLRIITQRLGPKRMINDAFLSFMEYKKLLSDFPGDMRTLLYKAKRGRIKIEFEHKGLEPLRSTLDAVSYRLLFGLVLAALIVGSSLMIRFDSSGWNVAGRVGFILGAVFAVVILVITVVRTFKE